MQEYLKRIKVPSEDGGVSEILVYSPEDARRDNAPLREQADMLAGRTATLEDIVMALVSGGQDAGAEAALLAVVASPAGDYTEQLNLFEAGSPGVLKRLLKAGKVSPEEIASHFPEVAAIVEPDDALFRFPAAAYLSTTVEVAAVGGLFSRSPRSVMTGGSQYVTLVSVDEVLYWNFSRHGGLNSGSARKVSGLVNFADCRSLHFDPYTVVSVDAPFIGLRDGWFGTLTGGYPQCYLKAAFDAKSYYSSYYGKTEQTLRHLPPRIDASECSVDRLFFGLSDVMSYPDIDLSGSVGRDLFTAWDNIPPKRYVDSDGYRVDRHALVTNLGKYRVWPPENHSLDKSYYTDFTGLVDWSYSDIFRTLSGALPVDVEWKLYLNRQTYETMQILGVHLADLTSKGYTVVCMDVPMETPVVLPDDY